MSINSPKYLKKIIPCIENVDTHIWWKFKVSTILFIFELQENKKTDLVKNFSFG